jgi:hypothetical protein
VRAGLASLARRLDRPLFRSRSRRRAEGGAVAVEAALITPIIFTMIFGMVEFAFVLADYSEITTSSRMGARAASTAAGAGACDPATPLAAGEVACPANGVPVLAQMAADSAAEVAVSLPKESVNYLLVYKANADGFPNSRTSMPTVGECVIECVAYKWRASTKRFGYAGGTWDSRQINACYPYQSIPDSKNRMDAVGVYLDVNHPMMTGLFGVSIPLNDKAVMSFEPLSNMNCKAGQHQ